MPVDTSIYANVNPPQPNPLTMAGQVASFQNALNQNRLFQQQNSARQAIGQAYQAATDPTTGQLDNNKFSASVAGNPDAAYLAGEATQQNLTNQTAQTELKTKQLQLAHQQYSGVANAFGTLAANPNVGYKDFISMGGDLISQGLVDPKVVATELANLPPNATPAQLQAIAKQYQQRNMDSAGQIAAQFGTPTALGTGGGTAIIRTPTQGGQTTQAGYVPNTKTVGEQMTRIPTVGPNGQPGSMPSPTDDYGRPLPQPSAGQPTLGTGRYPQPNALSPTGGPSSAPPPAGSGTVSPAAPAGFVPSGPKMGANAAADVNATASANQGVELQKAADQIPQQKALLGNLDAALDNFASGPGADWKKVSKSFVNANNPFGNVFDPKSIASQEEFTKQATQLVQSQFQALGGTGTDAKLDSASKTSPNDFLSPMGNKGIINMLKGNADAIAVKNGEWQSYLQNGGSPQDYGSFSKQFNTQYDPRVFQSVYMSPDQKQDLLKGLDKSEKTQFQQTYNYAVQRGWIPDPRAQNAAQ